MDLVKKIELISIYIYIPLLPIYWGTKLAGII
jgi:hypothetical protein